jgi:60 kDa SS-A/Ro ribonucleoprotein
MARYTKHVATKKGLTPQTMAVPGSNQVPNSAGGFSWKTDNWHQLDRFLVLGTMGGTYYIREEKLTADNADNICKLIGTDGLRVVKRIVEISDTGRAPKNDPAIFALALCFVYGDDIVKAAAAEALPKVCRIGTHLFAFAQAIDDMRGWGRAVRRAVSNWYEQKSARDVGFQMVKYQQRNGFAQRDVLRLSHPRGADMAHRALYQYVVKRDGLPSTILNRDGAVAATFDWQKELPLVWAHEEAKAAKTAKAVIKLIEKYRIPRESVPTEFLKSPDVWAALLANNLPLNALVRNLGNMTECGLLTSGSEAARTVVNALHDDEYIAKSRLHPLAILVALRTYQQGHGVKGKKSWTPVTRIVDALDDAFYKAFKNVEPTGKRLRLGLDVSGSMGMYFCYEGVDAKGMPKYSVLNCREASAAMALVTARVEKDCDIVAFCDRLVPITISPRQRLDDVIRMVSSLPFGGTDCSLPVSDALKSKSVYDAFCIYTDSETWAGPGQPAEYMRKYRQQMNVPQAKMVVVGMQGNDFTIADPNDKLMMDVVGFDTATPNAISEFVRM